jgi:3',5'-cyclic AMP phosphodiesterase CpdA
MAGGPTTARPRNGAAIFVRGRPLLSLAIAAVAWFGAASFVGAMVGASPPRAAGAPFAPSGQPDRIVLTPGADPARSMAVAYRTGPEQSWTEAEIAPAIDGPALDDLAVTVKGDPPRALVSANGPALYHQVRFSDLDPDTVYAYRLRGADGWSEWFQFRTAAAEARPFRFLYLGDVQNGILSASSRVVRQAFRAHGPIDLVLHAGDLVDQRGDLDPDDEWGEWIAAAGYHYAVLPQIPAAGNHEYEKQLLPDQVAPRRLGAYWPLQFALPQNGAQSAKATTYFVDFQGVRFIVLDGTSALDRGTAEHQARWLDRTLADSRARWNIVLFHQPIFSCGRPADYEALTAAWRPVLENRRVDLVLQGHDHCYSRMTAAPVGADGALTGPVYMVSVAGAKMYALANEAVGLAHRAAEATQLYQIVDVSEDRLSVRVHTATGRLYDGFDIERIGGAHARLRETDESMLMAERRCEGEVSPDGTPCRLLSKRVAFGR